LTSLPSSLTIYYQKSTQAVAMMKTDNSSLNIHAIASHDAPLDSLRNSAQLVVSTFSIFHPKPSKREMKMELL
jgi:hypothetical protein